MTTRLEQLYTMACRPGGVSQEDAVKALGWMRLDVAKCLTNLEAHKRYRVVVVRIPGLQKRVFGSADHAAAYQAAAGAQAALAPVAEAGPAKRPRPPDKGMDRKVSRQVAPDAKGYPGFDARYQVAPGARVFGAGFSAVGIGRDVTTGKPWQDKAQGAHG
jgi:hypothetical protein